MPVVASPSSRSPRPLVAVAGLAIVVVLLLGAGWLASRGGAAPAGSGGTSAAGGSTTAGTVRAGDLPPEARHTLALVKSGGPYPYARDGIVFSNREGLLPREPSGYYREYTVVTPGSADRGARRIIVGQQGEYYYTDDHYASFREVLP